MKLIYVANAILPSRTANSVHVMKMCAAFARNGHQVKLIVPGRPERDSSVADLYRYYGVPRSFAIQMLPWMNIPGRFLPFAWSAAREAVLVQADVVYARTVHACYFAARRGLATIFESHAPVEELDVAGRWMFERLIRHPRFRRLIVISSVLREIYEARYPELAGRIRVAPDAADEMPAEAPGRAAAQGEARPLKVGYTGHLYPGRGVELIARLAERCRWAEFDLIGGMPSDVERWRKASASLTNLKFHGHCAPGEVHGRMRELDVMLAPYQRSVAVYGGKRDTSRWMSPLKIFEYMAARKPMIVSDLPVLHEVLNANNAILVAPDDVEGWVQALEKLRDAGERERLAAAAHSTFLANHTWSIRANRVLA